MPQHLEKINRQQLPNKENVEGGNYTYALMFPNVRLHPNTVEGVFPQKCQPSLY